MFLPPPRIGFRVPRSQGDASTFSDVSALAFIEKLLGTRTQKHDITEGLKLRKGESTSQEKALMLQITNHNHTRGVMPLGKLGSFS